VSDKRSRSAPTVCTDPRLTRRQVLGAAAAGVAGLVLPSRPAARPMSRARLNVLLIIVGGERSWDRLPAGLDVPARERIQQRSVEFENCYSASPTPAPALAALLTGRHGPNNGVTDCAGSALVGTSLSTVQFTLADLMRDGGWHTAYFGSWPLAELCGPADRTDLLDDFGYSWSAATTTLGNARVADQLTSRAAVEWLETRATTLSQPWLATIHLEGGRGAADPSDDECASFDGAARARATARYLRAVEASDTRLGEILDALDRSGERSRTVVVYTSDCGVLLGEHGRVGTGPVVFEEIVNVPLLIDHPDAPGAVRSKALVSAVDVMPTVLGLVNVPHKARIEAAGSTVIRNVFSPEARGPRDRPGTGVLLTHSALSRPDSAGACMSQPSPPGAVESAADLLAAMFSEERALYRAVVTSRYKLARHFAARQHHVPATVSALRALNDLELYNLARDAAERRNIAAGGNFDRGLLKELNAVLNTLIDDELGGEDAGYLPGPAFLWLA